MISIVFKFKRLVILNNKFKAKVWSKAQLDFVDSDTDILEQKHYSNTRAESTDYLMFVPCDLQPNEVGFVKVVKTDGAKEVQDSNMTDT
jgi:hypothetical protein